VTVCPGLSKVRPAIRCAQPSSHAYGLPNGRQIQDHHLPAQRRFTREGITVEILIYRGENDRAWALEVVDPGGAATVWEDNFATEQDALNEVYQTIASEGIGSFLRVPDQKLH
jgi:hypothetical protein